MNKLGLLVFLGAILPFLAALMSCTKSEEVVSERDALFVYVAGKGLHVYRMDMKTGAMTPQSVAADVNVNFVDIHPQGHRLYGVGDGVNAFAIDPKTGGLTFLNNVPAGGGGPCHIVVDGTGKHVLVANYSGGSVVAIRIEDDGKLGAQTALMQHTGSSVNPKRQEGPHAHSINIDPGNRYAFAADLGLDKVLVYRFDASTGALVANDPPSVSVKPGAGPRHFTFRPQGDYAYVINELDNTVTAFKYDANGGVLTEVQTITTLPADYREESYTAEVLVEPSGRFLYGSNRGHHGIVVFAIDPANGTLTFVEHESTQGEWPRNFRIDPTGKYLLAANANTGNVVVFRIDQKTGALEPTGQIIEVPSPQCIKFL